MVVPVSIETLVNAWLMRGGWGLGTAIGMVQALAADRA
jgi:hypothetical protein